MKLYFFSGVIVPLSFLFFSCQNSNQVAKENAGPKTVDSTARLAKNYLNDCKTLFAEARKMDSILLSQTDVDIKSATLGIKAFTDFAYYCHNDSLSPVFLIKSAQVARAVNNIPQAKLVLDRCIEDYPSFKNRAAALFLLAQLYDDPTYLNNEAEAQRLYQKIIDEYPKSDWASSAKGAIGFIGKSDKQIMEALKKSK
jgi:hypothetical protein